MVVCWSLQPLDLYAFLLCLGSRVTRVGPTLIDARKLALAITVFSSAADDCKLVYDEALVRAVLNL